MTLSAYKRLVAVGSFMRVENYMAPMLNGVRRVMRVQSNAFTTEHPLKPGVESWTWWPKASLVKPIDARSFELLDENGKPWAKFELVDAKG